MPTPSKSNNFLADFLRWLNNTPEAKKDFEEFCKKHKLTPDYTDDDYSLPYKTYRDPLPPCGFRGARDAHLPADVQDMVTHIERAYCHD